MFGSPQGAFPHCLADRSREQIACLCHAAANDHCTGIEQVYEAGDRNSNISAGPFHYFLGGDITAPGGFRYGERGKRIKACL